MAGESHLSFPAKHAFALVLFLAMLPVASAQGIGVSPIELSFQAPQYGSDQKQLIIYNPNDQPIRFSVSAEDFQKSFHFTPAEADIPPHAAATVRASFSPNMEPGEYSTRIYISSLPSAKGMALAPAAAITAAMKVTEGMPPSLVTTFAVAGNGESEASIGNGIAIMAITVIAGLSVYALFRRHSLKKPF